MPQDPFFDVSAALAAWPDRSVLRHFQGTWSEKHWMNTPGPLYCGDCEASVSAGLDAPNNVEVDASGFPVLWRQPANRLELRQVLRAASNDPHHAFALDGDAHWSYRAVQAWWSEKRPEIEREVERERQARLPHGAHAWAGVGRWLEYFRNELHDYLRAYAFFLEEGRVPIEGNRLPDI